MRVLQVHNFYQEPGGEDQVYAAEYELLTRFGHAVAQYSVHNDAIRSMASLGVGLRAIWNPQSYREIREVIRRHRPAIVHAHNTFPIVSPALYYAAESEGVPVVQTLHNYRLICPGATLYRAGSICEDCVGKRLPWNGVLHGCYRGSRPASTAVASMLAMHRVIGTWSNRIKRYVALTEFSRDKFIEGGLPSERISVKPNFLPTDPGVGFGNGGYALFVGRLSEGKGLRTLLHAWEQIPDLPLKIVGDGPLNRYVAECSARLGHIHWLGRCGAVQVIELMKAACFLVIPSEWHEQFPITLLEAMSCGTPVIASHVGSLRGLVVEGENGVRFAAGNPQDLVRTAKSLLGEPDQLRRLRGGARRRFEGHYTAEANLKILLRIYEEAVS